MIVGGRIGQAPHSIEDLWVAVRERFTTDSVLQSIVIKFGHQFLKENRGNARVVFVQDASEFTFGAVRGGNGEIGTLVDTCKAHIWAVTPTKDYSIDQAIAAKALALEVCTAAYLSYSGMVEGGTIDVSTETHVLKYGEQLVVSIRLKCPIEKVTPEIRAYVDRAETRVSSGRHSAS